jgi:hypothetical protein
MAKPWWQGRKVVVVEITLTLGNGRRFSASWESGLLLQRVSKKALSWAKKEMTEQKTPGRSVITGIRVNAWVSDEDYDPVKFHAEEQ